MSGTRYSGVIAGQEENKELPEQKSWAQQAFWTVPALRDVVATLRGWQIMRERYGSVYSAAIPAIAERATWSADRMHSYVNARLRQILDLAANHVPHYRDLWRSAGIRPQDVRTVEDLRILPTLSKMDVRSAPERLCDERIPRAKMIEKHTSGTTGTPITVFCTPETNQLHYAYFEVRHRRIAGIDFGNKPYAMLGAQSVAPPQRRRPPFWCYNHAQKQLYMSIYHLFDEFIPAYIEELRRRPYHCIMGYPSVLYTLSRYILDHGVPPLRIGIASTTAETLLPHQRETIERALGCRIYDQYGSCEMALFASEHADGRMYISPDYGIVEVLRDDGQPAAAGEVGEVVVTGLVNETQLFIRYRLGDRLAVSPPPAGGPPFPVITSLDGRTDQVMVSSDLRLVGGLDTVVSGVRGVRECQIVQEDFGKFRIRVVASSEYHEGEGAVLQGNLAKYVGDGDIRIELTPQIERTKSGKFEALVNKLTAEQIAARLKGRHRSDNGPG